MATKLIEDMEVTDAFENKKNLSLTSFYGGDKKGMCLHVSIRHLEGLQAHMGAELTREQALEVARVILERFSD
jgi:hypothetical protein